MTTLKPFDIISRNSRNTDVLPKLGYGLFWLALFVATLGAGKNAYAAVSCTAANTITANVAVLDSPTVFNRLGAQNPNWITYALLRDVVKAEPDANGILQPGAPCTQASCSAGNVMLRPDKRPRPLVLRSVEGACLKVNFTNLLDPLGAPGQAPNGPQQLNPDLPNGGLFNDNFAADRCASFHATGVELVDSMDDDGSFVGKNDPNANVAACTLNGEVKSGVIPPGATITYNLYTPHEGAFTINSYGATIGSEQNGGNLGIGMFGALNVQPKGAKMYRSQVTEEELRLATVEAAVAVDGAASCTSGEAKDDGFGVMRCYTPLGQPIIDYEATYPPVEPWVSEGKADLKVLNMVTNGVLQHSDINAIIAGPGADGSWNDVCPGADCPYPLESKGHKNPQLPNRLEPFREFTSIYHDEQTNSQVFPNWYNDPVLNYTLAGVKDQFMINYGSGGIGSEIISNRLHTGPMHDCTGCAYEEFFLASQTVGDPGLLVNYPANTNIEACSPRNLAAGPNDPNSCWRLPGLANGPVQFPVIDPTTGQPTGEFQLADNYALYQEDPSNVHHTYVGDFVKIRNTHAGSFEQHIFHLHNHQWLFNPNDDNANYLDAQEIMPGSGHTYELVNGGAGNRNKTAGDAIFHCHFYPHFAQGMWYHIRIQDVLETGSTLAVSTPVADGGDDANGDGFHDTAWALRSGKPAALSRALPDAELAHGVPIPATVPLPGKAMPHTPAPVHVVPVDRGEWSLLGGRKGPDGIPESSQAVVDYDAVAGADGILHDDLSTEYDESRDNVSPGFPFWLAGNECGVDDGDVTLTNGIAVGSACPKGTVGHRMPTPPLDMLTEEGADANGYKKAQAGGWDGGLPRHNLLGYSAGSFSLDTNNRLDFAKEVEIMHPVYFPETGTDMEKVSMAYHAKRNRDSYANNLLDTGTTSADWVLNGAPPVPGAPFQDPCIDDKGSYLSDTFNDTHWWDGDQDDATWNKGGRSTYSGDSPRTYRVANVQIDAVFNKVGNHYSQERIIALWADVEPSIMKQRPPEPLVMRFNTFDCGRILHSNVVPKEFEVDDFQVRTPTDIIGQHIHLPKWDLTTNDGAANGWNYEDGALAPGMVQERITAINHFNELVATQTAADTTLVGAAVGLGFADKVPQQIVDLLVANNTQWDVTDLKEVPTIVTGDPGGTPAGLTHLTAKPHPFFGTGIGGQDHVGARTVIQRILVDPVLNVEGVDRGLGLTFSHDHYGPSTFQQIGLYSTILAEPAGSTWSHNETGADLYGRTVAVDGCTAPCTDGGPTSWQAIIKPPAGSPVPVHREFYFEMSDFQHAYEAGFYIGADARGVPKHTTIVQPNVFNVTQAEVAAGEPLADSWRVAVNPPLKVPALTAQDKGVFAGTGPSVVKAEPNCPGDGVIDQATGLTATALRPCAEAINISHSSMWVSNYRNEPVGLRVFDPNKLGPDGKKGSQADGEAGDLAFALMTRRDRAISELNTAVGAMPYPVFAEFDKNGLPEGVPGPDEAVCDGINCDRRPGDPITPIMRAYERDNVKVKIQVGATEEQHQVTVHGMKWLSNGSGFGRSPNSGWRNFQSHGISEQFSLQVPVTTAPQQPGDVAEYLYANDATRDGIWSGTWGILRAYRDLRTDLVELPGNPAGQTLFANKAEFNGVCPTAAPLASFDVTAVLANQVLPNELGVTFPANVNPVDNVGGPLEGSGTLVYNRRVSTVGPVTVGGVNHPGGMGPLNDPTAIMYVRTSDLEPVDLDGWQNDPNCQETDKKGRTKPVEDPTKHASCPVKLKADAPVEPLVLRANAGDCIEVVLRNRLPEAAPDLAGYQDMMWVVNRELGVPGVDAEGKIIPNARGNEMHFFNNNLIRPSSHVGLHPQLVAYDVNQHDGVQVGTTDDFDEEFQLAPPGGSKFYRWYAGDIRFVTEGVDPAACDGDADRKGGKGGGNGKGGGPNNSTPKCVEIVATPVEFGGTNLLSADRVKQPQKGLFGALVIEPEGACHPDSAPSATCTPPALESVADGQGQGMDTRLTRAQADISSPAGSAGSGGNYREALSIGHKIANLRWKDGSPIRNVNQLELGREGAEDSGHAGFNYGMEPPWYRFMVPPDVPFGNAGTPGSYGAIPNAHAMYANQLVAGETNSLPDGDPATPVFTAESGQATRMYVLNGASADRDGTFILHGHLWQRDPYVCPGENDLGLTGKCYTSIDTVDSTALGMNPIGKWMGSQEGMGHAYGHWPILFNAGGTNAASLGCSATQPCDFLFRDYSPSGNRNGQFGILRVKPAEQ